LINNNLRFDEIGYWSEIKLDIVKKYAQAYSTILSNQKLHHVYVDAFAGSGVNLSRQTGEFIRGSPLNALLVEPPFRHYFFIDIKEDKTEQLRGLVKDRKDISIYTGDANVVLLEQVFPKIQWSDYRRGLCLLDPYGLHVDWEVLKTAGHMKTVDIFLNFPVMDMNRNALWRNPDKVRDEEIGRMTRSWGDESWRNIVYSSEGMLFKDMTVKQSNEVVIEAFRKRLNEVGGFGYVSEALPMRNSAGVIVYYLLLASQKAVAAKIVNDIFNKFRNRNR